MTHIFSLTNTQTHVFKDSNEQPPHQQQRRNKKVRKAVSTEGGTADQSWSWWRCPGRRLCPTCSWRQSSVCSNRRWRRIWPRVVWWGLRSTEPAWTGPSKIWNIQEEIVCNLRATFSVKITVRMVLQCPLRDTRFDMVFFFLTATLSTCLSYIIIIIS